MEAQLTIRCAQTQKRFVATAGARVGIGKGGIGGIGGAPNPGGTGGMGGNLATKSRHFWRSAGLIFSHSSALRKNWRFSSTVNWVKR